MEGGTIGVPLLSGWYTQLLHVVMQH